MTVVNILVQSRHQYFMKLHFFDKLAFVTNVIEGTDWKEASALTLVLETIS